MITQSYLGEVPHSQNGLGGFNLYAYALNNPVDLVDPLGLSASDGECPEKWSPDPVWGRKWQYGCYCGKEPSAPRKTIPPPIDDLDKCCQIHDNCYAAADKLKDKAAKKAAIAACDTAISTCAKKVLDTCNCQGRRCLQAANAINKFF